MALPYTDDYIRACLGSARVGVRCELRQDGVVVARPDLASDWRVRVQSGSARSLTGTVIGFKNLLPDVAVVGVNRTYATGTYGEGKYGDPQRRILSGLMTVAYTEIRIWHRLLGQDGVWREMPAGRFWIAAEDFELDEADGETIRFTAYDERRALEKAGWTGPYKVAAGNGWTRAVALAQSIRPDLVADTAAAIGYTTNVDRMWFGIGSGQNLNPWQVIQKLAGLGGFTPYIDANGKLTAVDVPALASSPTPVWTFDEDTNPSLFTIGTGHDDEELVNTVVVTGSTTKRGPIYAVAQNNTAGDPHRVAKIGRRTLEINASGLESSTDAQTLADKTLRRRQGTTERIRFDAVLFSFLEEWDVIGVRSEAMDLDELALLGGYDIHGEQNPGTGYDATRRVA